MNAYDTLHCAASNPSDSMPLADCTGPPLMRRGKDKDVYNLGDLLLIVATDRLSACGKALGQDVRGKGRIVNGLSAYWFRKLGRIFPNHFITEDIRCFPDSIRNNTVLPDGYSTLVWKATPLPVRLIVRGYLAGAGWREYRERGEICGIKLPADLRESQRLPSPVFSSTMKGETAGADEPIDFSSLQRLVGKSLAELLREISLGLYVNAWKIASERGVLIADTKFEFGFHHGKLLLIDECLTPDTSRFWAADGYRHGGPMPSMDKQLLIDYLETLDNPDIIPRLPDSMLHIIEAKYNEAYRRIVGKRDLSNMEISGIR